VPADAPVPLGMVEPAGVICAIVGASLQAVGLQIWKLYYLQMERLEDALHQEAILENQAEAHFHMDADDLAMPADVSIRSSSLTFGSPEVEGNPLRRAHSRAADAGAGVNPQLRPGLNIYPLAGAQSLLAALPSLGDVECRDEQSHSQLNDSAGGFVERASGARPVEDANLAVGAMSAQPPTMSPVSEGDECVASALCSLSQSPEASVSAGSATPAASVLSSMPRSLSIDAPVTRFGSLSPPPPLLPISHSTSSSPHTTSTYYLTPTETC
jgi:hypothetical protein